MSAYLPEQNSASIVSPAAPKGVAKENASFLTRRRFAIASVVMLVFMAGLAHWLSLPPRPLSSSAPPEVFSAERALKHIEVMAQEVHPAGSKENEEVFAYICSQLDAMGIAYVVHTPLRAGNHDLTITRAVLARIPGTAPTKAFAIDGHFDSTPYGPGAADDVSACAAMLETARALKAGPPLMNDIILCFTDMEEEGTLGAWAVTQHPWFEEIGVMLGLEARGTSGPVHMFETSQQNGWLIQELARAGVQPRASSIMFDVYEAMPFGSDFSTRYKKTVPGYNIAFTDDFCHYHTKMDNPETVSLASVQHMGAHTLGLAKHLGNLPLYLCEAPNATYFNTLGSHMIVYPQDYGPLLAGLALPLFLCCLAWALYRNYVTLRQLLGALLVMVGIAVVVGTLLGIIVFGLLYLFREHALYSNNWYCLGGCAVALSLYLGTAAWLRKSLAPQSFLGAGLILWAVLLVLMQQYVPGGAHAPLLGLVCGSLALMVLATCHTNEKLAPPATLLAALLVLPPLVVIFPLLVAMAYSITLLGMPVLAALLMLLASLAIPQFITAVEGRPFKIFGAVFAFGVLVFLAAFLTNFPSADCPKQNCLSYGMDHDRGKAWWLSTDAELDAYTENFFGPDPVRARIDEFFPGMEEACFKAPAPFDPSGPTRLEVLDDVIEGGRRKLKLFLDSPRDAQRLTLTIEHLQVFEARMLDHVFAGGKDSWTIYLRFFPREGAEVFLEVEPNKPLLIHLREESYAVPQFPEVPKRPDWMMAEPNRTLDWKRKPRSEHTFSVQTHDLGVYPPASAD